MKVAAPQTASLEAFNALHLWDLWIESFDTSPHGDRRLVIHGGTDHPNALAALEFHGTEYLACPTLFHHARVRIATTEERESVRKRVEFEAALFVVETDVDGDAVVETHFIAAESVVVRLQLRGANTCT